MKQEPIWKLKSFETNFSQLQEDISVDVAIIGGGITGITTALLLKRSGLTVVVLEARRVGQGTTGHSTGNLYEVTEYDLKELNNKYDLQTLHRITRSRRMAMDLIAENVKEFAIDCDLEIVPMYIFEKDGELDIDDEIKVAEELDLPLSAFPTDNFPFPLNKGMMYNRQAHLNPLSYVQQLAKHISKEGCNIYENTHVREINEDKDRGKVILKSGQSEIVANFVVHATHTPLGVQLQYHPVLGPYREYGIAVKLDGDDFPQGIFWGNYKDKKYSLRIYNVDNESYLICVGSMHKTGQTEDNQAHINQLIDFVQKHFKVKQVTHQWGGQNYKPADLLPYIGKKEDNSRQYIATGFSTDGLVYGSLSAMIISDLIIENENIYSELYKATRHKPVKAAKKFLKENINMAGQMIKDLLDSGENFKEIELETDEGKIVQYKGNKVAAYKNMQGQISILSPICTHMGCTVHWNNAEKSWDCPCHGSRFDTTGKVIEGPALTALQGKDK